MRIILPTSSKSENKSALIESAELLLRPDGFVGARIGKKVYLINTTSEIFFEEVNASQVLQCKEITTHSSILFYDKDKAPVEKSSHLFFRAFKRLMLSNKRENIVPKPGFNKPFYVNCLGTTLGAKNIAPRLFNPKKSIKEFLPICKMVKTPDSFAAIIYKKKIYNINKAGEFFLDQSADFKIPVLTEYLDHEEIRFIPKAINKVKSHTESKSITNKSLANVQSTNKVKIDVVKEDDVSKSATLKKGRYIGEKKDSKKQRKGKAEYADGSFYQGEWKDNKYHGPGKLQKASGVSFTGNFSNGKPDGYVKYSNPNLGVEYAGDYKNGKRSGFGIFTYKKGQIYEGEWERGSKHGKGKLTLANGDLHWGSYKNGTKDGLGIYIYGLNSKSSGLIFSGLYKDGKRNGKGFLITDGSEISVYQGNWDIRGVSQKQKVKTLPFSFKGLEQIDNFEVKEADGPAKSYFKGEVRGQKPHGKGIRFFSNGDIYIGQFSFGQRHGLGYQLYRNSAHYLGNWKADLKHGYGTSFNENGKLHLEGTWHKDSYTIGISPERDYFKLEEFQPVEFIYDVTLRRNPFEINKIEDLREQNRTEGKPLNFGFPTTKEEINQILNLSNKGKNIEELVQFFQRPRNSIEGLINKENKKKLRGKVFTQEHRDQPQKEQLRLPSLPQTKYLKLFAIHGFKEAALVHLYQIKASEREIKEFLISVKFPPNIYESYNDKVIKVIAKRLVTCHKSIVDLPLKCCLNLMPVSKRSGLFELNQSNKTIRHVLEELYSPKSYEEFNIRNFRQHMIACIFYQNLAHYSFIHNQNLSHDFKYIFAEKSNSNQIAERLLEVKAQDLSDIADTQINNKFLKLALLRLNTTNMRYVNSLKPIEISRINRNVEALPRRLGLTKQSSIELDNRKFPKAVKELSILSLINHEEDKKSNDIIKRLQSCGFINVNDLILLKEKYSKLFESKFS